MKIKTSAVVFLTIFAALLIGGSLYAWPVYKVWSAKMDGKAAFAEAEQNRQITIEEASANLEAQKLNALSEIERAKGMAEAMKIEDGALTKNYIDYLWVRKTPFAKATIIYVPVDGNLPMLEASRILKPEAPAAPTARPEPSL